MGSTVQKVYKHTLAGYATSAIGKGLKNWLGIDEDGGGVQKLEPTPATPSAAAPTYAGQKIETPTLTKYQKRLLAAMAYGGSGSAGGLGGYTTTGSSTKTMLGA